jgi:hypothetical protein
MFTSIATVIKKNLHYSVVFTVVNYFSGYCPVQFVTKRMDPLLDLLLDR